MTQPASSDSETVPNKVQSDRELLQQAAQEGKLLGAYVRLSGPGWLQSAITLGGGSLAGALYLGVLGGTSMIWLQLVAIVLGVVMLSAISYVTLSTGRRPFEAINSEINPVLGWGWLIATCMANIIWCMPQYSLCYDALDKNIFSMFGGSGLGKGQSTQAVITTILFAAAFAVVLMNIKLGAAAKWFDRLLKALIAMIVLCFFAAVTLFAFNGQVNFSEVFAGFVPNFGQFFNPAGQLEQIVQDLPAGSRGFWHQRITENQRSVMIAAAAAAVGINMTFLLPYSMLARGWDKPFRGLARFDLSTGMAIPYVLVTSCVVIAAAVSFHAQVDDALVSEDLETMRTNAIYGKAEKNLLARIDFELGDQAEGTSVESKLEMVAALPREEKLLAAAMVKRDAFELSKTLSPLLGDAGAKFVFGMGVFGMGFSTIIILMLINGHVFREMVGKPDSVPVFVAGVLVAGVAGGFWFRFWSDPDLKFYLAIYASTFGAILLPVAYITFFLMMNSRRILKDDKPTGMAMVVWNVLMGLAVVVALIWAATSIYDKATKADDAVSGPVILTLVIGYLIAVVAGFLHKHCATKSPEAISAD